MSSCHRLRSWSDWVTEASFAQTKTKPFRNQTLNDSQFEKQSWRNLSKTWFVFLICPWSEFQRYKDSAESLEEHLKVIVPLHKVSTSVDDQMVYCSKPEAMKKQSGSSKIHEKWISLKAAWSGSRSSALQHELKEVRIPRSHSTRVFCLWTKFNYPKTGIRFLQSVNGPVACWLHGPFSGLPLEKPFDLENRERGLSARFHPCWRWCRWCPLSKCNPLCCSLCISCLHWIAELQAAIEEINIY